MAATCTHLDLADPNVPPHPPNGCAECLQTGSSWVHLRLCPVCGHVGCCDASPNKHATAHAHATAHPLIRSYEPGEDWWYCYPDDLMFRVSGVGPVRW